MRPGFEKLVLCQTINHPIQTEALKVLEPFRKIHRFLWPLSLDLSKHVLPPLISLAFLTTATAQKG